METLTALKTAHMVATVVLLAGALGLGVWVFLAKRKGDATAGSRTLQRPRVFIWLLMGLALLSMPFTGWGMVHLVGWPLGRPGCWPPACCTPWRRWRGSGCWCG